MSGRANSSSWSVIFNVPNQLTALRLILAIVVFALIPLQYYLAALIIFIVAVSTDWVDGYWARKYDQVTQLGRIFDPFVDKIIICGTFIFLAVAMREIPQGIRDWMAVVVVGREMLVTALRGYIEQHGGDFSARFSGKLKMVLQSVAACAALLALMWGGREAPAWLLWVLLVSAWAAVLLTLYSGLQYIVAATRVLSGGDGGDA